MNKSQRQYYNNMISADRAFLFYVEEHLGCIVTYYIGNGDASRYMDRDPWVRVIDEPTTGTTCYVDQLLSNHNKENYKYNWTVWKTLIQFIKNKYPQVNKLTWKRHNNKSNKTYIHSKTI